MAQTTNHLAALKAETYGLRDDIENRLDLLDDGWDEQKALLQGEIDRLNAESAALPAQIRTAIAGRQTAQLTALQERLLYITVDISEARVRLAQAEVAYQEQKAVVLREGAKAARLQSNKLADAETELKLLRNRFGGTAGSFHGQSIEHATLELEPAREALAQAQRAADRVITSIASTPALPPASAPAPLPFGRPRNAG